MKSKQSAMTLSQIRRRIRHNHKIENRSKKNILKCSFLTIFIFEFFFKMTFCFTYIFWPHITWVVEMRIWCIKIVNVLVLHFNPWVKASAGGLLVPEGLYSPVAKYFGTCIKIRIWIELSRKSKFSKFISKRRLISLRHSSILRRIWLNATALCLDFIRRLFHFSHLFFGFPTFLTLASLKRLE
jgi:hypothetical protein